MRRGMLIVGLDLAGVETRPTGFCVLKGLMAEAFLVYTNDEIVRKTEESYPKVVAIDAPLSLPAGRRSIQQRTKVHLRECDKELLKKGIHGGKILTHFPELGETALYCITEVHSRKNIDSLVQALREILR